MPPRVLTVFWCAPRFEYGRWFEKYISMPEALKLKSSPRAILWAATIVSRGYIEGNEPEVKGIWNAVV